MNTEVSIDAGTILDPVSGEIVNLSDTPRVVAIYEQAKEYQARYQALRDACRDAIIEAADERAEWNFEVAGAKVTVDPPSSATIDWQMDELEKLEQLLPPERYAELVKQTVVYEPQTGKLQALARQSGVDTLIWKIITAAEHRRPKNRYIRVSR